MFDKREVLVYHNVDPAAVMPRIIDLWTQAGFFVTQMSPLQIYGECAADEMGIKPKFNLVLNPQGETTIFDLTVSGKITDTGILVLVLLGILFWPVALILGLVSYMKFEDREKGLSFYFWGMMNSITDQTGTPPYGPPPGFQQPPPPQGQPPPK